MTTFDPGFPDGLDSDNPAARRTSAVIMQNLLASLDAAYFALNELDPTVIKTLHTNKLYMKRLKRLLMPVFAFLVRGAQGQSVAAGISEEVHPVNMLVEGEPP